MRIISGKFKSKKIIQPLDKLTRPLKDITKESIFNILLHSKLIKIQIENSKILDLFSGSGSFGLECISRGAKKVIFCENYHPALKILEQNIINIGCLNKTEIIKEDIFKILKEKKINEKFNLVFLDPPFKEEKVSELLINLKNSKILEKNGIIILHRNKKSKDNFSQGFNILIEKFYGLSKIYFIEF
tara:strand:+ start:70 stop:630 length:561 start_codon:yes stop_codon:yes gene_type:complete